MKYLTAAQARLISDFNSITVHEKKVRKELKWCLRNIKKYAKSNYRSWNYFTILYEGTIKKLQELGYEVLDTYSMIKW